MPQTDYEPWTSSVEADGEASVIVARLFTIEDGFGGGESKSFPLSIRADCSSLPIALISMHQLTTPQAGGGPLSLYFLFHVSYFFCTCLGVFVPIYVDISWVQSVSRFSFACIFSRFPGISIHSRSLSSSTLYQKFRVFGRGFGGSGMVKGEWCGLGSGVYARWICFEDIYMKCGG